MSDLKLNPQRLAEAITIIENCFDKKAKEGLEARASMIMAMPDSTYKEELLRCEAANEANYNSMLTSVRALRESVNNVKEVAEHLAKRDLETTKTRESDNSVEVADPVAALRPF